MKNINYLTLAAVRAQDPAAFDAMITEAVMNAALEVGLRATALAIATRSEQDEMQFALAA